MSSRRLISWLFALVLLLGQAAAFAHALSHINGHESAVPDKVCEICVAQAQLGNAAPVSVFSLPIAALPHLVPPAVPAPPAVVRLWRTHARAPPAAV